jgi:hypothetical protein
VADSVQKSSRTSGGIPERIHCMTETFDETCTNVCFLSTQRLRPASVAIGGVVCIVHVK